MALTTLSPDQVGLIAKAFPRLPDDYLRFLRESGWGEAPSGFMIYSGPIPAREVYGEDIANDRYLLLGDDLSGYCLAFDLADSSYGEIAPDRTWTPWPEERTFASYSVPNYSLKRTNQSLRD